MLILILFFGVSKHCLQRSKDVVREGELCADFFGVTLIIMWKKKFMSTQHKPWLFSLFSTRP